jgi:hypothetical protein
VSTPEPTSPFIEVDPAGRIIINTAQLAEQANTFVSADDQDPTGDNPNLLCPQINTVKGCGTKLEETLPSE